MRITLFTLLLTIAFAYSCKKDDDDETVNPFQNATLPPDDNPDTVNLEPGSFAFLHYNIFKPTCANSGCHDGNFEPDFRTISSSYNTLVRQDVIQNDDAGNLHPSCNSRQPRPIFFDCAPNFIYSHQCIGYDAPFSRTRIRLAGKKR